MEEFKELNFLDVFLPLITVVFIIALGVVLLNQHFQKNLFRQQIKQEELRQKHQQELLRSSIDAQEELRKRIAQDLHDELGAALSIARMQLVKAENDAAADSPAMKNSLANIRSITENALSSMRKISHQLMPPMLERYGLLKTLQSVQEQVNQTNDLQLHLHSAAELPDMSWEVKVSVYRITMELIQNTIKHAGASTIHIDLGGHSGSFALAYTDNGKGLNAKAGRGLGLKSLEARVNALGGTLEIMADAGFSCRVSIPLKTA